MASNRSCCVRLAVVRRRRLAASALVQCLWPCMVLKWNFTQKRSLAALMKRVGVRAVAVDVATAVRQAAIRHQDRHLMQAFRRQRPEIPHRGRRAQVGLRMALLRVDEVGELQGIADEEHRRVVADEVPVAFLGVELQREAAHVALGIRRAAFAGDGREAQQACRSCLPSCRQPSALVYLVMSPVIVSVP